MKRVNYGTTEDVESRRSGSRDDNSDGNQKVKILGDETGGGGARDDESASSSSPRESDGFSIRSDAEDTETSALLNNNGVGKAALASGAGNYAIPRRHSSSERASGGIFRRKTKELSNWTSKIGVSDLRDAGKIAVASIPAVGLGLL
jgi:hypothetical protein